MIASPDAGEELVRSVRRIKNKILEHDAKLALRRQLRARRQQEDNNDGDAPMDMLPSPQLTTAAPISTLAIEVADKMMAAHGVEPELCGFSTAVNIVMLCIWWPIVVCLAILVTAQGIHEYFMGKVVEITRLGLSIFMVFVRRVGVKRREPVRLIRMHVGHGF